jgi:lipoate synthase
MRPTKRHMKVDRYVDPSEFDMWRDIAEDLGFLYVASGPLVRSSYKVCCYQKHIDYTLTLYSTTRQENST